MTGLRQREPRERCEAYLAHIRTLPCLICGQKSEAAHIRMACREIGKDITGGGRKPSDKWALPLCHDHHTEQHDAGSEVVFWNFYKLDPFAIAQRQWRAWRADHPEPQQRAASKSRQRPKGVKRSIGFPKVKKPWPSRPLQSRGFAK